jgi:hypothetical protein
LIRFAKKYDIPRLLEIVESYAFENPIDILTKTENHFPRYVEELLFSIIQGRGFILIDNNMTGALIAIRQNNIWSPKVKELHELLWWVEPQHRNGMVGGRLWKEFDKLATQMLDKGDVNVVFTSVQGKGPIIDYTKRGYKVISANFAKE